MVHIFPTALYLPSPCSLAPPGGGGLRQEVAVKRLKPEVLKGTADLKDFLLEGNLMRKLQHKWVHGAGEGGLREDRHLL